MAGFVFVMGAARSGTTAMAELLKLYGAAVPERVHARASGADGCGDLRRPSRRPADLRLRRERRGGKGRRMARSGVMSAEDIHE